ncbi:MAG: ribose 5-phosphate isomerase B [Chloroflexota bacterium]
MQDRPRIAIGADDLGYALKESLEAYLTELGYPVDDFGCHVPDPVDYPDVAEQVARAVAAGTYGRAILVCGTGIGMAITANKVPGVRAAQASDPYSAERARKSNDAQVLCLGARIVSTENAKLLVDHWLASEFQGGGSARKVAKMNALDAARG